MGSRAASAPALGPLEAAVMEVLWTFDDATVRTVVDTRNAIGAKPQAYTTVMSVMHRLDRKGLVSRRREGKADVYRPRASRTAYRRAIVDADIQALIEQYGRRRLRGHGASHRQTAQGRLSAFLAEHHRRVGEPERGPLRRRTRPSRRR